MSYFCIVVGRFVVAAFMIIMFVVEKGKSFSVVLSLRWEKLCHYQASARRFLEFFLE